ncbi:MAG: WXG100 family type VII secretion target [Propionibacteriaceae bacterium]|jgi:uncharacterized protein YukE|nr:WXG100 family type VII secretion target [Propionibacteriaceae bacterium]
MAGIVGMNPTVVQSVARELKTQSQELAASGRRIDGLVSEAVRSWAGVDAQRFRSQWTSSGRAQVNRASNLLAEMGQLLQREAQEQLDTSNRLGATFGPGGGAGGPGGSGSGGSPSADSSLPALILDWLQEHFDDLTDAIRGGAKAWKTFFTGPRQIMALLKAFPFVGQAGLGDEALKALDKLAQSFRPLSKVLPRVAPFLGAAGGLMAVGFGLEEAINGNGHSGWRDVGDRVSGGLQVVSGVGLTALAIGGAALLATPVGPVIAGVAVVAGVASAAWELGNLIYDHRDDITNAIGGASTWVGDQMSGLGKSLQKSDNIVVKGAGVVVDGIGKGASAVGNWFKGLF